MYNIWTFLLQTASVTIVAGLLLVIKGLLADKLSPRWQYGVWGILALRILIPVDPARQILLPLPLWIETLKSAAERGLSSAYSAVYTPIGAGEALPWLSAAPGSITDWLLIIYLLGVPASLLRYFISYASLRRRLRRAEAPSGRLTEQVSEIAAGLGIAPCPAAQINGLDSAFVCGVIKPILAVPAGAAPDGKILLHELLHLKHRDALQNMLWGILRAVHWCNPFMHYVFDRIGNDMEALCDQRVLERLEGEERRRYGEILLGMANSRYARAPLTSSISNGSRNIARRIEAIVRFKKYPKGMTLVSLCIAVVLLGPTLAGSANAYGASTLRPGPVKELDEAMAAVRLSRCTTPAGAIDAYAKGLLYENGVYIAAASPLSRHGELETAMRRHVAEEGWVAYHLDSGEYMDHADAGAGYDLYDLVKHPDGTYTATLTFKADSFINPDSEGLMHNEEGVTVCGGVIVPIRVSFTQADSWTVEELGRSIYIGRYDQLRYPDTVLPWLRQYKAAGESGTVTVSYRTDYTVGAPNGASSAGEAPIMDAEFSYAHISYYVEFMHDKHSSLGSPTERVTVQAAHYSEGDDPAAIVFEPVSYSGSASGSSSQGTCWANAPVTDTWDGGIFMGSGGDYYGLEDGAAALPYGCVIEVQWDGEAVERFVFSEEDAYLGT